MIVRPISPTSKEFLKDIPPVLYKYRDWQNLNHQALITNGEVYFSSFDQLNDPFEGAIPFRYKKEELTIGNLKKKYFQKRLSENKFLNIDQIEHDWQTDKHKIKVFDKNHTKEIEQGVVKMLNAKFGVFSLCATKNNLLLWSYYSQAHKGFCIGYDIKQLVLETQSSIGPVRYSDTIPRMGLFEEAPSIFMKLTQTKALLWKHEEEYRLRNIYHIRCAVKISPEIVCEVIFGSKISEKDKSEITTAASALNKNIKFFQASINEDEFKVDVMPL